MEIEKTKAVAEVPGTSFRVEAEAQTLEEAQSLVLKLIDQQIDNAVGGVAKNVYDYNRGLKDAVVVEPPIKEK